MPRIEVNGIQTYYESVGSGPVVIFVSGLGGTAGYWKPQIEAFSRHFTVITYDQRGAGRSDHPEGSYSIELLTDDLAALITALEFERPMIVGHSTGGAIGQVLAARTPALLGGMVQYASWPRSDAHFNWCFRMRRALLEGASLEEYVHGSALFLYPPEYIRANAEILSPALLESVGGFPTRETVLHRIDAIMAHDAMPVLSTIETPTLVLCASDDILTPPYQSRLLASSIPGARLEIVEQGGHSLSETETEIFNRIVLNFLATCTAPVS